MVAQKILELRAYEITSETIFGPIRCCFSEARRQSYTCMNIYPFFPLRLQHWLWCFDRSLISQATPFADEDCETNHSLRRTESCWKEDLEEFFRTVHSHVASFNMPLVCLGALCGHLPSNGADWRRHASHDSRGKKWSG